MRQHAQTLSAAQARPDFAEPDYGAPQTLPPDPPPDTPPPEPDAPQAHDEYRWTPHKALAFLEVLAECGKVAEAARAVGMTRQSAYRLRQRSAMVAEGWPLALAAGKERRRAAARRPARASFSMVDRMLHGAAQVDTQVDTQGDSSGAAR